MCSKRHSAFACTYRPRPACAHRYHAYCSCHSTRLAQAVVVEHLWIRGSGASNAPQTRFAPVPGWSAGAPAPATQSRRSLSPRRRTFIRHTTHTSISSRHAQIRIPSVPRSPVEIRVNIAVLLQLSLYPDGLAQHIAASSAAVGPCGGRAVRRVSA